MTVKTEKDLARLPDGGWGWVVVFGSFMTHFIADGVAYSFGVFLNSFIDQFGTGRGETGWLGSLIIGVTWSSGPVASALTNKFGCRFVTILGALMSCGGFIVSIFAPNIWFMYFSFGIVSGLGMGLIYLPSFLIISFYFDKKRSFATGIAVCGAGLGGFAFAPLSQFLLDIYGWKGTVLIEAGILLNCAVFGALFRPVTTRKSTPKSESQELSVIVKEESLRSTCTQLPAVEEFTTRDDCAEETKIIVNDLKSFMREDTYSINQSSSSLSMELTSETQNDKTSEICESSALKKPYSTLALFQNPIFLLFITHNIFSSLGFCVPYIFLPDRAKQFSIPDSDAAFLLSIIGISSIVARLVWGRLADVKCVDILMLFWVLQTLGGAATCLSVVATNYPLLAIYAASFGTFIGGRVPLFSGVTVELLGLENLATALAWTFFFGGVAATIGPPIAGWVFDATGDYETSFYMMGGIMVLSGLTLAVIPCVRRCQEKGPVKEKYAHG